MFELLLFIFSVIIFSFGFVVLFGAPFLPTLKPQIHTALDLLDLQPGQRLLEIGSGDGRVLIAAAERGIISTGYEINPFLVLYTKWKARKHHGKVTVVWGNGFTKKWPATDGIYIFGLQKLMPKLHKKVIQSCTKSVRIASIAFQFEGIPASEERNGVYLYKIRPSS
jgi:SAM-dependent methyltransferase